MEIKIVYRAYKDIPEEVEIEKGVSGWKISDDNGVIDLDFHNGGHLVLGTGWMKEVYADDEMILDFK